jgi:hypothetical protein
MACIHIYLASAKGVGAQQGQMSDCCYAITLNSYICGFPHFLRMYEPLPLTR